MSFILDALKKSESDRQRQNGPGLYEVKVAAPRSQLPYWAIGLIVLLGVNLVIVAWALLRRPSRAPDAQVTAAMAAPSVPGPGAGVPALAPASPGGPGSAANPAPGMLPPAPAGTTGPTSGYATSGAAPGTAPTGLPMRPPASQAPVSPSTPHSALDSGLPQDAAAPGGPQGRSGEAAGNPDDYAPASEPGQPSGFGFHVRRGTEEGVPLYSQVATAPGSGIPDLRLDLHAYAPQPENRFVLINMKRLREGDSLPEGVKVEAITPDGVILSHNGTRFLLPRE